MARLLPATLGLERWYSTGMGVKPKLEPMVKYAIAATKTTDAVM
jgi:hypothetical protein